MKKNKKGMRGLSGLVLMLMSPVFSGGDILLNCGFDEGLAHWKVPEVEGLFSAVDFEGRDVLMGTMSTVGTEQAISQSFPAKPGEAYEFSADIFPMKMKGWSGIKLCFYNETGGVIDQTPNWQPSLAKGWSQPVVRSRAPEGTVGGAVLLFFNGAGSVYWDNIKLNRLPAVQMNDQADVEIVVTDEIVCADFRGFGYEDDGWFYNEHNAEHGVNEADAKIREARIEWMNPDNVRMFFWNMEWNPAQDWATFDWETDDMQSHYRTLDLYQKIGTEINLAGVEWGHTNAWPEPKVLANSFGALLEYLIKTKGYSCIKYWTLSNEPDGYFNESCGDFNQYVRYHVEMKKELARRGLEVQIVGSDDMITDWFDRCLNTPAYNDAVDMYSSHIYIQKDKIDLANPLFAERIGKLEAKTGKGKGKGKPWTIGEYGFRDERLIPPYINPFSEDYVYALHNHGFVIDGLNHGVASFQYWCIHEMYYVDSENRMLFGLWNYKDRDWGIRPVYHSMASLCRLSETGDVVYRCTTTQPDVKAARVGNTLFWVNGSATAKHIQVKGFSIKSANIMAEDTLFGERECGITEINFTHNTLHVPAQSFGSAQSK